MTKPARFSAADIARAKAAADKAGLCLKGFEVRPDGSIKLEFGNVEAGNDWRAGSPLYEGRA
jgi:hypothetical protein